MRTTHQVHLGVIVLVGALLLAVPAAAEQAWLGLVNGEVEVGRGDPPVFQRAASGEALSAGDEIRTGRDGRAELVWQGATIRLYGDSVLRLPETQRGVSLDKGNGLFDVLKRVGETFDVETPEVVVSVKGTRFGVALEGSDAAVSVYRGQVGVRAQSETLQNEVMVREGFRALGSGSGPAELFLLGDRDPWKAWGPNAAPPRSARTRIADETARVVALRDAKAMARRTYQREALAQASARDPELAKGVARMEGLKAQKRRELGDGRMAPSPPGLPRSDDMPRPLPAKLDPVMDSDFAKIEAAMIREFTMRWANGSLPSSPGAGSAGTGNWNLTTPAPQTVQVDEVDLAQSWVFTKDELQMIVLGYTALPTTFAMTLANSGLSDPQDFIKMLLVVASNTQ